jgi:CBS domain-containing protein
VRETAYFKQEEHTMNVSEIMTTNVATAEPDTTLEEIASMMKDENVGAIPIVDDEELIGIVTDRDIVVRCVAEGKDPAEVEVEEILTEDLETIAPDDDVREAAQIMQRKQIRRLPVCDDDGKLVGMVALGDIAVKEADDDITGETLEQVSQGVKSERSKARSSARAAAGTRGANEGRQGAMEEQGIRDREVASNRGRSSSKARVPRGERAAGDEQGIANRGADEEMNRQDRVVAIRDEGKAGGGRKRAS